MSPHCTLLQAGDLTAIVGDDVERGPGGSQYSGIWSLVHRQCPASPFQSAYAGLIAGAHRGTGPTLEPIDDHTARLVLRRGRNMPYADVVGTYQLVSPHYVDYTYGVHYHADAGDLPEVVQHSWCSYMASPLDRSIHFIEDNVWTSHLSNLHGSAALVQPRELHDDRRLDFERRTGDARFAEQTAFHQSISGRTFDQPFYFGVVHNMVYLLMADDHADFRFYMSPSGAGTSAVPGQASPAWDFMWLNWRPQPGETRTLHVRVAFFPQAVAGFGLTPFVWKEWDAFRETHPTQNLP